MVISRFRQSRKQKIIFLDYDGTLTSSHKLPEYSKPSSLVLDTLAGLSAKGVLVYILSGRGRVHLDEWFKGTGIGLGAEHGCFYKHPESIRQVAESKKKTLSESETSSTNSARVVKAQSNHWLRLADETDLSWRDTIRPLFQHYTQRTPGSFIEEKEVNLTWHYQNTDPEFGSWQAAELQINLEKILSHMAVSIVMGNKTLELRPSAVDKATAAKSIIQDLDPANIDFILCVGDGKTDEVVFSLLKQEYPDVAVTCTVIKKETEAQYYLDSVQDVSLLLHQLEQSTATNN